jgi:hypothetical protein
VERSRGYSFGISDAYRTSYCQEVHQSCARLDCGWLKLRQAPHGIQLPSSKTTFILAIEAGKEEVVKLLFEHGAIFDVFRDFTCLNAWSVAKEKDFKGVLEALNKYDGKTEF